MIEVDIGYDPLTFTHMCSGMHMHPCTCIHAFVKATHTHTHTNIQVLIPLLNFSVDSSMPQYSDL